MSAVAPAEHTPAVELELVGPQVPTAAELAQRELNRWLLWFGLPVLAAAFFVGGVFATGRGWLIAPAASLIVLDIFVLVWLAMSSDTNGLIGEPASH